MNDKRNRRFVFMFYTKTDRSLRRPGTITVNSDDSSASRWDGHLASPQRPSFEDNLMEFVDIMVKMESHGVEVCARYI